MTAVIPLLRGPAGGRRGDDCEPRPAGRPRHPQALRLPGTRVVTNNAASTQPPRELPIGAGSGNGLPRSAPVRAPG